MTYVSFFQDCAAYKTAPRPFWDGRVHPRQLDKDAFTSFVNETWSKFDPRCDNRLEYIKEYWNNQDIRMDGSYKSLLDFELWIWERAKAWRVANPRPAAHWLPAPLLIWEAADGVLEENIDEELISLGRDVAIYHAHVILTETKLSGTWKKWKGSRGDVSAGFPFVEIDISSKLRRIDLVRQLFQHIYSLTICFTPGTLGRFNTLSGSARHITELMSGIRLHPLRPPYEPA